MRDEGLEETLRNDLRDVRGVTEKPMFGGLAFLLDGKLLCAAGSKGMLVRLGKGCDGWALESAGVVPMRMTGRTMAGWVRLERNAFDESELRDRLLAAALSFVRSLPAHE